MSLGLAIARNLGTLALVNIDQWIAGSMFVPLKQVSTLLNLPIRICRTRLAHEVSLMERFKWPSIISLECSWENPRLWHQSSRCVCKWGRSLIWSCLYNDNKWINQMWISLSDKPKRELFALGESRSSNYDVLPRPPALPTSNLPRGSNMFAAVGVSVANHLWNVFNIIQLSTFVG